MQQSSSPMSSNDAESPAFLDYPRKRSRTSQPSSSSDHHHDNRHINASFDILLSKRKKRDSPILSPPAASSSSLAFNMGNNKHTNEQLMIEISNLKCELSSLQSIHNLDKIKAENIEKRLKRHIISLEEDANESSNEAMKVRMESEKAIEKLNHARRVAVNEAREWREKFICLRDEGDYDTRVGSKSGRNECGKNSGEELDMVMKENEMLQHKVAAMEEEITSLRTTLFSAVSSTPSKASVPDDSDGSEMKDVIKKSTPLSPAPPAVLSELNRTRVKLSDSECTIRQLKRTTNELQNKVDQCNIYKEKARSYESKVDKLEYELKQLRRERESLRVVEGRWTDLRKELAKYSLYKEEEVAMTDAESDEMMLKTKSHRRRSSSADEENVPPEIATIIRQLTNLRDKVHTLEKEKNDYHCKMNASNKCIQSLQKQLDNTCTENKSLCDEKKKLEELQQRTEQELKIIRAQEGIAKREVSGMRLLLDTYKQMEINLAKGNGTKKNRSEKEEQQQNDDPTVSGLKLSLDAANEQVTILRKQFEESKNERDGLVKEKETVIEENTRIRNKFEKLREALYKEKERAEQAETKALEAETLAGKGSFNPDKTRVLHLQKNPMATAVRTKYEREIKELNEQLKALSSESSDSTSKTQSKGKGQLSELDAQKLNKRLKESFRAQIGHFREGVYLLTGYKIDMVADLENRPRFKVRSMYAENESDVLEFIWPQLEEGQSPVSLDILNTKLAQVLSNEPCFEYMKRYNSLPAFMASVCLSLFEKQTMV